MIYLPKNIENASPSPVIPNHKFTQNDYVFESKYLAINIAGMITGALLIPRINSNTPK